MMFTFISCYRNCNEYKISCLIIVIPIVFPADGMHGFQKYCGSMRHAIWWSSLIEILNEFWIFVPYILYLTFSVTNISMNLILIWFIFSFAFSVRIELEMKMNFEWVIITFLHGNITETLHVLCVNYTRKHRKQKPLKTQEEVFNQFAASKKQKQKKLLLDHFVHYYYILISSAKSRYNIKYSEFLLNHIKSVSELYVLMVG